MEEKSGKSESTEEREKELSSFPEAISKRTKLLMFLTEPLCVKKIPAAYKVS